MYRNILIATDGSELAGKALEHGLRLARFAEGKATVLTVCEPFRVLSLAPAQLEESARTYREEVRKQAEAILSAAAGRAQQVGVECETLSIEHDEPHAAIIDTAHRKGCDLIVMASHGRRGLSALVLGSQTVKVLTHSDIPVLVLR